MSIYLNINGHKYIEILLEPILLVSYHN